MLGRSESDSGAEKQILTFIKNIVSYYSQRFEFLLSFLVLHADGAAHEDDEEDDEGGSCSSDDDRNNIITNDLHWTVVDALTGNIQRQSISISQT